MNNPVESPLVEIHDLTVSYYKKPVLWGIDLALPPGKLIGVIGPNGAGKSTLLKAIMGLVPLDSGFVKLFNKPLHKVRNKVSYVPQRESVDWDFPASVLDVVVMGRYGQLRLFQRPGKADKEMAMQCLQQVGMEPFAQRQIAQLSVGQQQRVFLARALAQEAQLYLLDEPFAGLDAATEKAIIALLQSLTQEGKSVILVHHDLHTAPDYFDWAVLLNMRLIGAGPTQKILTPALLQETYAGKLTILSQVSDLLQKEERTPREDQS